MLVGMKMHFFTFYSNLFNQIRYSYKMDWIIRYIEVEECLFDQYFSVMIEIRILSKIIL